MTSEALGLRLGLELIAYRRRRFIRQTVSSTLLVSLLFVMIVFNMSFNATFRAADDNIAYGDIIIDRDGVRFLRPGDLFIWNNTEVALNENLMRHVLSPLRDAYLYINTTIAGIIIALQAHEAYKEARRDNEEYAETMGAMYAFGARPGWVYGAFMLEKLLSNAVGLVAGNLLAAYAVVPLVMARVEESPAAPFFYEMNFAYGFLLSAMFVSFVLCVKSLLLARATRNENLREIAARF